MAGIGRTKGGKVRTKYKPKQTPKLAGWMARSGLVDKEIAKELGISESTLNEWKKKYPEFKEALTKSKKFVDYMVENALLKRALGFDYEEKHEIDEPEKGVTYKTIKKKVVPDTVACIFWLKNRTPNWKDKQDVEHSGSVDHIITGIDYIVPEKPSEN